MYEERYIAFIDILGFKDIVAKTCESPIELNKLDQTLGYLEYLKRKNYEQPWGNNNFGMEYTMFSDSVVISYPVMGNGNAYFILQEIVYLCLYALSNGYIFRGGVTVGKLIHRGDVCYGPAMNEAVNMEKRAKYPRIIVDKKVIEKGIEYHGINNTPEQELKFLEELFFLDDGKFNNVSNSEYILNYLAHCDELFDDEKNRIRLFLNVKKMIMDNYKYTLNSGNDEIQNIHEKYVWLVGYFNYVIDNNYIVDNNLNLRISF